MGTMMMMAFERRRHRRRRRRRVVRVRSHRSRIPPARACSVSARLCARAPFGLFLFWRIFAQQKIVWFFSPFFFEHLLPFGKKCQHPSFVWVSPKKKTRYKTQNATLCDAVYRRRRNEKSGLSNSIPRARERGGVSRAFSRRRRNPSSCPVLFFSSSKSFY